MPTDREIDADEARLRQRLMTFPSDTDDGGDHMALTRLVQRARETEASRDRWKAYAEAHEARRNCSKRDEAAFADRVYQARRALVDAGEIECAACNT